MTITRRLLIPTLAFLAIILIGLLALQTGIDLYQASNEQEESMATLYNIFNNRLLSLEDFSVALATEAASNPEIQATFAAHDREKLTDLTLPSFLELQKEFGIVQYQYHLPPATSFLRLHQLDRFDDDLSTFRRTVLQANATQQPVSGLEIGRAGLGIRGVVPVQYEDQHIGTVEFGLSLDQSLLNQLKTGFGSDWQILIRQDLAEVATFDQTAANPGPTENLLLLYSTLETPFFAPAEAYNQALNNNPAFTPRVSQQGQNYSSYTAPLRDFSGTIIGTVNIITNRAEFIQTQTQKGITFGITTFIALAIVGIGLGTIITRSLRPVGELTTAAEEIAAGNINRTVPITSKDELGILAKAFNAMTTRLRELIDSLEERVAARTRDLELAVAVGRDLSEVQEVDELLVNAVNRIRNRFGLYYAQIYLVDQENQQLVLRAGTGEAGEALLQQKHTLNLEQISINSRAVSNQEAVIVSDTQASNLFRPNPLLPNTRSEMSVPLISGPHVIGVLDMQSDKPYDLTEENLPAFQTLAGQLAIAIENATLFTQRQRSEEALRRNEGQLREAQSIARLGYWEFDIATQLFTFTDQIFEMMHTTAEAEGSYQMPAEVYNRRFVHPEDISLVEEGLLKAFKSPDPDFQLRLGYRFLRVDGEVGYALVTMRGDRDENGRTVRIYGTGQDITERHQAEETLRQTQQEYESLFLNAADAIEVLDTTGHIINCNPSFTHMLGYERDEIIGKHITEFFAPESKGVFAQLFPELMEQGFAEREVELLDKEGHIHYIRRRAQIIRDAEGEPQGVVAYSRDVTEGKAAEELLNLQRAALEAAADGIAITDRRGSIQWINPAFTRLTQFTFEEALGNNPRVLKSGVHDKEFYNNMWGTLARGEIWQGEIINRRKDGVLYPEEMTITPVSVTGEETTHYVAIKRSIVERKKTEQQLRENEARLAEANRISKLYPWEFDITSQIFTFTEAYLEFLGTSVAENGGYEMSAQEYATVYVPPEESPVVAENVVLAIETEDPNYTNELESLVLTKDGRIIPIRVRMRIEKDGAGNTVKIFGANQDITETKAFTDALQKQAQDLQTVAEVSTKVAGALDEPTLLQDVANLTKERFGLYHVHIYLLDPTGKTLTLAAGAGEIGQQMVSAGHSIRLNQKQSLVARAARTHQGVVVNDVQADPGFLANPLLPDTRAEMAVPLIAGDEVLGVLDIQAVEVDRFTEQDVQIQTTLAAQTAVSLQNARFFAQSQQAMENLSQLTRRLTREGWEEYLTTQEQSLEQESGYIYDLQQGISLPLSGPGNEEMPITQQNGNGHGLLSQALTVHGQPIGHLSVVNEQGPLDENVLDDEATEIMAAIAEQLSARIENLRLSEQTERALAQTEEQAKRLAALNEMAAALNEAQDVQALYQIGTDQTRHIAGGDRVAVTLLDAENDTLTVMATSGAVGQTTVGDVIHLANDALLKTAVRQQRVVNRQPTTGKPSTWRSSIIAPLVAGNRVIGTLHINQRTGLFTQNEENLVRQVAILLSSTLENQRLFDQTQEALGETAVLYEASAALNAAKSFDDILAVLRKHSILGQGAQNISLNYFDTPWLPDQQPEWIEVLSRYSELPAESVRDRYRVAEFPVAGALLHPDRPTLLEDLENMAGLDENTRNLYVHGFGAKSTLFVPLVLGGQWVGYINAIWQQLTRFPEAEVRHLSALAGQAATAVSSQRLFAVTQARAEQLAAINEVSRTLSQYMEREQLLEVTFEQVKRTIQTDTFFIGFYDPVANSLDYPIIHEGDLRSEQYGTPLAPDSYSLKVIKSGSPLLIHLTENEAKTLQQNQARIIGSPQAAHFAVSLIFVPLIVGQRTIGVMAAQSYQYNAYTHAEMNLLSGIASYLSVALENVRLFTETQQRARREQILREITARVRGSADVETVMRTAVQEIGRTLGRKTIIHLDKPQAQDEIENTVS